MIYFFFTYLVDSINFQFFVNSIWWKLKNKTNFEHKFDIRRKLENRLYSF